MAEAGDGGGLAGIARRNRLLEYPTCVDCLFHSRKLLDEESLRRIALRTRSRTELFVETFLATGEDLNGRRTQLNQKYLKLVPHLKPHLEDARTMLSLSALGNSLDHNMKWWGDKGVELDESLSRLLNTAVVDHRAQKALEEAGSLAILLDNSGEAVMDIAIALALARRGVRVALVARSGVYEIDVDAPTVRGLLAEVADTLGWREALAGVSIVETGSVYPAPASRSLPPRTAEVLRSVDLVVSKGIANAEALLDSCQPQPERTIVALTAKCPPIARLFQVPLGAPLARLGYPCGLRTRVIG